MKPSHTRFVRPKGNSLDTGNVNTHEGFDANLDLAHARYTARVTGGMWTWQGEELVRITAPEVVHRESREAEVRRVAERVNPGSGPDPELCCVPGCPHTREVRRVICRNHTRRWSDEGKPPLHIWIPAMVARAKQQRKAGAA